MKTDCMTTRLAAFASLVLLCLALAPRDAHAVNWIVKQNETHTRWNLTPTAAITPWYFAPGIRIGIPIAKTGFLPTVNDSVRIEFGAAFQIWWHPAWGGRWCGGVCDPGHPHYDPRECRRCQNDYAYDPFFRIGLPVLLRWDFFLTKVWSVYVGLGFEFGIPFDRYYRDAFGPDAIFWIAFVMGTRFHVRDWFAFRIELGTLGVFVFGFEFLLG